MKKYLLIVIVAFALSCSNAQNEKADKIVYDENFVSVFSDNDDFELEALSFKEVQNLKLKDGIDLRLFNVAGEGWENDPGDFRKIQILSSKKIVFELVNISGWIIPGSLSNEGDLGKYFYEFDGSYFLCFVGYPYASDSEYLTVLYVDKNGVKLVFNDGFKIEKTQSIEEGFLLIGKFNDGSGSVRILKNEIIVEK